MKLLNVSLLLKYSFSVHFAIEVATFPSLFQNLNKSSTMFTLFIGLFTFSLLFRVLMTFRFLCFVSFCSNLRLLFFLFQSNICTNTALQNATMPCPPCTNIMAVCVCTIHLLHYCVAEDNHTLLRQWKYGQNFCACARLLPQTSPRSKSVPE